MPHATHEIPDCMKHLPTYRGLPVPYVAIWEAERVGPRIDWTPQGIRARERPEFLRTGQDGILWLDTPDRRGQGGPGGPGIPNFGGTHSTRQRNCMRDPRCQVCGRKQNPRKLLWVVPDAEDQQTLHDEHGLFINPPTCQPCFEGAKKLCPHLLTHGDKARVYRGTPRLAGVHGTYVFQDHHTEIVYFKFDNPETQAALKFVMGRQLLVSLTDEVEVTPDLT